MLELKPTWRYWACDAREARCPFHAARLTIPSTIISTFACAFFLTLSSFFGNKFILRDKRLLRKYKKNKTKQKGYK